MAKQTKKVKGSIPVYFPDGESYSIFCQGIVEITEGKGKIVYTQKVSYEGLGKIALPKGTKIGNRSLEDGIILDPFACVPDCIARMVCEALGCYNRDKK